VIDRSMAKRGTRRLMAVLAVLALALLATHAVSHWHNGSYDTDNCQICHVGQAAIPQPAIEVAAQSLAPVAHFSIDEESAPHLDFVGTPSIPRAPPA
jgi:hypothetical protein